MAHDSIATDSPLSRRIVRAFVHFLNSVEPGPGIDAEGIEVARDCLTEAFKLNSSPVAGDTVKTDSLIDIFKSLEANKQCETSKSDVSPRPDSAAAASSSFSGENPACVKNHSEASKSTDEDSTQGTHVFESKDELCDEFFAALDRNHYFGTVGLDDPEQLEKASCLFDNAFMEMERSSCHQLSLKNMAESLKSLGNKAMQSKKYSDAIDLYNAAIALYEKSAVYYCNRAAAYTQINKYTEAIQDCIRSIEIDPNYSKAYSRLGMAYYAQGNYRDAIELGFRKALQLDPNNETVKENIRVAEGKLSEEIHHAYQHHNQGCFRRNVTVVTIYASLGEEALCYSLNETEVTTVICGQKELGTLLNISGQLDSVKRVICLDDDIPSNASAIAFDWIITSFAEVERLGRENPVDADLPLSADVAVIMYTSGSTGLPKGVMMTHGNVLATLSAVMTIVPDIGTKDVYLAYLPMAHILELAAENLMAAVGVPIGYGSPLTLTDTSNKIKRGTKGDATALRPTLMAAVPAILDRVRDGVFKKVNAAGGLPKKLFHLAYARRLQAINGSWFGAWGLEKALWNFLVFRKVRAILGGRIRFILCGGAPLSGDTQKFINICLGAPIGQGYGLTETCAGGTFSDVDDTSVGRVGPPLPCSYIKLIDWPEGGYLTNDSPMPRGEIVIGGPNVTLGYFKNEEKTKELYKVDERGMRWFYTGDVGRFHPDGCLEIIDRKKDIVKLQHGEYVSLGKVEAALIVSPFVDNIMVHADPFHSYCVALVVGSQSTLEEWASEQGISDVSFSELCEKEETVKEVHASLVKEGKEARLEKFEIPAKIKLLSDPWTPETGLVTAALKLKREAIKKTFDGELSKLYAS